MDEYCKLQSGKIVKDFDCLLNCVDGKSDKFYLIQVLKNGEGFHVWTRWGRNGTAGQMKLDGPLSEEDAEKNFKKKFEDKTKNNWDKREQFRTVKGKYMLVQKTGSFQSSIATVSQTLQKPEIPDENSSIQVQLPADVLCAIFVLLSLRDLLRCMQVCKLWKTLLSENYFWKMYIQRHFDLGIKSDLSDEGPMARWSSSDDWYPYFEEDEEDTYVLRPFPSVWNCRVVHPFGLDPLSGDVRSLQGFCRSLEILAYMRSEASRLGMQCGNQCSASESQDSICAVLFPWNEKELPTPLELLNGVLHFHPQIYEYYTAHPDDKGEIRKNKLHFHIRPDNVDDSDYDEEADDHDLDDKPCLNRIFGMDFPEKDELWKYTDSRKFYEWLQPIMYPSVTVYAGEDKLNPVVVFMLTQLAPGWVGGALTAVIYT